MDDALILCCRKLAPLARKLGIQGTARRAYEWLAAHPYPPGTRCTARQNGRTWRLWLDVTERCELQEFETVEWLRRVVRPGLTVIESASVTSMEILELAEKAGFRIEDVEPGHELRSAEYNFVPKGRRGEDGVTGLQG